MPNSISNFSLNTSTRPPLAGWMGGKSLLAQRIIDRIPAHTCYVEPFAGAAWVLFKKPESKVEVINDINKDVVTLYRCLQWHLEEFVRYFKWVLVARDEFERLKVANVDTLTDIQRAARFYYLQQSCFGGRISSPSFSYGLTRGPKLNLLRIEEHLSAAHLRLSRVYVECLAYADIINRYDGAETFFYLDPPYWDCENYYGKGIFRREDFNQLAAQLAGIKGQFLLSLNDTPGVREVFKDFAIESVQTKYTCCNDKTWLRERFLSAISNTKTRTQHPRRIFYPFAGYAEGLYPIKISVVYGKSKGRTTFILCHNQHSQR